MDDIKLSFIIPCHNIENYIKPLLLSFQALNTDGYEIEWIFILDDCTDNTESIIRYYMAGMNYLILKCCHHSCGLARNEGLEVARGEYVWFVDGDDWLTYPNVLQDVIPRLEREKELIVQLKFVSNYFNREHYAMVWQYIYRRSAIGDQRFLSIQPHEDQEFNKEFFTKHNLDKVFFYKIPSYFYNYCRPGSNMSQIRTKGEINP